MSSHQKQQGYVPSTNSMFTIPVYPEPPASSLLFQPAHPPPEASQQSNTYGNPQHTRSQSYGSQYGGSGSSYTNSFRPPYGTSNTQYSTYPPEAPPARTGYPDARPPRPPKEPVSPQRSSSLGLVNAGSTSPKKLRTVVLPPSTLPRFLSIAAVNTSLNKETCGLLLGKLHKDKLYVSTLLIPRQEGTSDTCSMTHEELVVQFQLDRDLTTVGWVRQDRLVVVSLVVLTVFLLCRFILILRSHVLCLRWICIRTLPIRRCFLKLLPSFVLPKTLRSKSSPTLHSGFTS
jgi:STAM-binding protein